MERKFEIKQIENISNAECRIFDINPPIESIYNVGSDSSFSRRCHGLMYQVSGYMEWNQMDGAVVVFFGDGDGYFLAKPGIHDVLDRYYAANSSGEAGAGFEAETEAQKRIRKAMESGRWEETVENLGPEGLDELYAEMESLKREVAAALEKLSAAKEDPPAGGSSTSPR